MQRPDTAPPSSGRSLARASPVEPRPGGRPRV